MKNSPSVKKCKKKGKPQVKLGIRGRALIEYNNFKNALRKISQLQPCTSSSIITTPWHPNYKFKVTRAIKRYLRAINRTITNNEIVTPVENSNRISISDRITTFGYPLPVVNFQFRCSKTFLKKRVFKMADLNPANANEVYPKVTITFEQMLSIRKKRLDKKHNRLMGRTETCIEIIHTEDESEDVIEIKDDCNVICVKNNVGESTEVKCAERIVQDVIEIEEDSIIIIDSQSNDIKNSEIKSEDLKEEAEDFSVKDLIPTVEKQDVIEIGEDPNVTIDSQPSDTENVKIKSVDKKEETMEETEDIKGTDLIPVITSNVEISNTNISPELTKETTNNLPDLIPGTINHSIIDTVKSETLSHETPIKMSVDETNNESIIFLTPNDNDLPSSQSVVNPKKLTRWSSNNSIISIADTSSICQDDNDIIFVSEECPAVSTGHPSKSDRKSSVVVIDDDDNKQLVHCLRRKRSQFISKKIMKRKKKLKRNLLRMSATSTVTSELANCVNVKTIKTRKRNRAASLQNCSSQPILPMPEIPPLMCLNNHHLPESSFPLQNYPLCLNPMNNKFGSNIHNIGHVVREGLRQIVIDGSNVAIGHSNGTVFSVKGLQIAIDYFIRKGHKVKAFIPQYRVKSGQSTDPGLLHQLIDQRLVILTPSREVKGRRITPYDDRYIIQYAMTCEGIVVSNDNFRDLLQEKPEWRPTIERRLLMYTWVDDILIFPEDPLGRHGPKLSRFLRFP